MRKNRIGNTTLEVAPLAFGGNVFGWTIDAGTSEQLLDQFTGAGFNLIDTADVYSRWKPGNTGGESEVIIGDWMKKRGKRDQVIIATKGGGDMGQGRKDISRKYIIQAAEASLKRLQTDHIDLYQTHWDVIDTPLEETLSAYQQLINEGKIRFVGASNYTAERLEASIKVAKANSLPLYQSFQPEYNLYSRKGFEQALEKICLDNNIGVINYYSLAAGFLTGKYRTEADAGKSVRDGGSKQYLNDRGYRILEALDKLALQYKVQQASIAIAWLVARPVVSAPIASATSAAQLETLTAGAQLELSTESLALLDEASAWD